MNNKNNASVIETFSRRVLLIIGFSAISIASLISYFSYSTFATESKQFENDYINSQKKALQLQVNNAERIINYNRSKLDKTIRNNIKQRVYDAHAIATHLYEEYKNTKSKIEIINIIKNALRPLRFFNGRGYIFIDNLEGKNVLHPILPNIEGADVLKSKNKKGIYFARNLLNIVKEKGEGYYSYDWIKPNEKGQFTKVSFVKHFKPYNWSIGTGDYLIEVEREIQNEILERIGEIQFDKEGYIFVVNYDGNVMMNRGNRSLIGKSILDVTDSNGVRVAEEVIKLAQTPDWDGYFNYTWKKLSSEKTSPKMAYHKMVQDWGWYYGAGVYLDDLENVISAQKLKLKNKLFFDLFLIALTMIFTIFLIYHLAKRNTKQLYFDLSKLLNFFSSLSIESSPINIKKFKFLEFNQLGDSANSMLEQLKKTEEERQLLERTVQHSQRMDAISQMVGGVAHDFNNLLAVILGYGELLESKLTGQSKLESFCRQINIAGKRGANLTRKLLSLTKTVDTEAELTDINILLNENNDLLKKSLTAKINLEFNLNNDLWQSMINRYDFEDAMLNLCVNAMHAMRVGQQDSAIKITTDNIHYEDGSIFELDLGDYVRVTVSDNGIGISDEVMGRLFEPFYTTRETGTGLGLSQVYNFTKRCLGTIQVSSTPGVGTKFELFFPRYKDAEDINHAGAQLEEEVKARGTETILIVDDEEDLRVLGAEFLGEEGYKVLQAENGVDALAILKNEKVDLVLSDVIMPIMDGNLLAKRVEQLYPHIKIQLISGYMNEDKISEINSDLYENILTKPAEVTVILQRVRQLLDQKITGTPPSK